METIAITNWNKIVSPLYDASCCLLIAKPDGQRLIADVKNLSLLEKTNICIREKVDVLICGAMSNEAHTILQENGVKVYSWICGSVDELIDACKKNVNISELYAMPGCGKKICYHRKTRGAKCARFQ
jgi:predicted Fe-Mo cluster-binding NifX family protein